MDKLCLKVPHESGYSRNLKGKSPVHSECRLSSPIRSCAIWAETFQMIPTLRKINFRARNSFTPLILTTFSIQIMLFSKWPPLAQLARVNVSRCILGIHTPPLCMNNKFPRLPSRCSTLFECLMPLANYIYTINTET